MPFNTLAKRRAYVRAWRKRHPGTNNKYYRVALLKKSSPARQKYYLKLWAIKDSLETTKNDSN